MKLVKNGSQNKFEKNDTFSYGAKPAYRECSKSMPAPNLKNTYAKAGPLKPTRTGSAR